MRDKETDPDGAFRVPPMALTRYSRGGKSRALLEIARKLRGPDQNVIRISFSDLTTYSLQESKQVSVLQSLKARIAWTCAKEKPPKPLISDDNDGINFLADEQAFQTWLSRAPNCILLIDELNNAVQPKDCSALSDEDQQRLSSFLIKNFCGKAFLCFIWDIKQ